MPSNILFFILLGGIVRMYHLLVSAKRKLSRTELFALIIFPAFTGLVYIVRYDDYNLFSFGNVCLGTIILLSVISFAKYILPKINEIQILIWVMMYWYTRFSLGTEIATSLYIDVVLADIILIILSAITFIISILHVRLSNKLRLLLYVWFMAISTSVLYFALPDYSYVITSTGTFPDIPSHNLKTYVFAILYGFQLFYIVCNMLYLFYLIPIPGKHQSMKDRIDDLKEFLKLLSAKFDSYQFKSGTVMTHIFVTAILLYLNFSYDLFSISNTILLTLTAVSFIHRWV